jgi:ATP-dependent DNA ligase
MSLPVQPPVSPMLAKSAARIPAADAVAGGFSYEPKWDGFRAIVFRDGDDVVIGSRNEKPLTAGGTDRLDFERLLERIHPAQSRVQKLSVETPATFVAFDLLALDEQSLLATPFDQRRQALGQALAGSGSGVRLTALTDDASVAERWFAQFEGAGLDGVVAKANRLPYLPGERAMIKVKHTRTADVVLAGYRLHKTSTPERPLLGSMLLGLHDDTGSLHQVGVCASFKTTVRAQLVDELAGLVVDPADHPWAGEQAQPNRWNAGRDTSFVHLRPARVVEVGYDHMEGTRFRHTTQFKRWRPDREPSSCTFDQLEEPVSYDLADVWTTG